MDIEAKYITFTYEEGLSPALHDVSFSVKRGELVAVLGANGSGKSTLARTLNALLPLQEGELTMLGMDVRDESTHHELHRACGMVFPDPDNQFVSSVAEEDVAFGLYYYDIPQPKIEMAVRDALAAVDLTDCARRAPHSLSGGEKQRLALAGVMALGPRIVIFDEAASMLDWEGRREIMTYLEKLRRNGVTVLWITHQSDEAVSADRVLILSQGRIIADGTPRQVLTDREVLDRACVTPPFAVQVCGELRERGIILEHCPVTEQELTEELCRLL